MCVCVMRIWRICDAQYSGLVLDLWRGEGREGGERAKQKDGRQLDSFLENKIACQ